MNLRTNIEEYDLMPVHFPKIALSLKNAGLSAMSAQIGTCLLMYDVCRNLADDERRWDLYDSEESQGVDLAFFCDLLDELFDLYEPAEEYEELLDSLESMGFGRIKGYREEEEGLKELEAKGFVSVLGQYPNGYYKVDIKGSLFAHSGFPHAIFYSSGN